MSSQIKDEQLTMLDGNLGTRNHLSSNFRLLKWSLSLMTSMNECKMVASMFCDMIVIPGLGPSSFVLVYHALIAITAIHFTFPGFLCDAVRAGELFSYAHLLAICSQTTPLDWKIASCFNRHS